LKINPDATYTIPEGNLFPGNNAKTRPEIYTMGHRNPYRITVDKKTGFLYWGEVGPDSATDSLETRGPRGYDEVNQARKAGFFGWPLFIANNYPYRQYNYATGVSGEPFDPAHPINNSRNNTGLQDLPPAQPAFIYYPYNNSKEFPQLGAGGRNAMAGPVYYTEIFPEETRYPEYFNGKLFIYDWMRNWIKLVHMKPNGDFDKMDACMESSPLNAPIDMEVGPDGRIYVLEYGQGWFSKNVDAGLIRIDYLSGNRPPKVDSLKVAKESGTLPFTVSATVKAIDPEGDKLTYRWRIGETVKETNEPRLNYVINKNGEYPVTVEVVDDNKAVSKSSVITVYAGNEQPQVAVDIEGNKSFYFTGKPVAYNVKINDGAAVIDTANVFIKSEFIEGNEDLAAQGHQIVPQTILGKNLTLSLDCKSCHKVNEKSIGPSYMQVAQRYHKDPKAGTLLIDKIIKGGAGNWGEVAMPAHTNLKEGDAKMITEWVLSLASDKVSKSLPLSGKVMVKESGDKTFSLTASYTDLGGGSTRPLSGSNAVYLRSGLFDLGKMKEGNGFAKKDSAGTSYLLMPQTEGSIQLKSIDLTGIKAIELTGFGSGEATEYAIEILIGGEKGRSIGKGKITFPANKQRIISSIPIATEAINNKQDIFFHFRKIGTGNGKRAFLKNFRFIPK
jgi:cytochrome c551/c552